MHLSWIALPYALKGLLDSVSPEADLEPLLIEQIASLKSCLKNVYKIGSTNELENLQNRNAWLTQLGIVAIICPPSKSIDKDIRKYGNHPMI